MHDKLWDILEDWRGQLFFNIPQEDLLHFACISGKMIENINGMRVIAHEQEEAAAV